MGELLYPCLAIPKESMQHAGPGKKSDGRVRPIPGKYQGRKLDKEEDNRPQLTPFTSIVLLIFVTRPCRTFPGPTSVNTEAPSATMS